MTHPATDLFGVFTLLLLALTLFSLTWGRHVYIDMAHVYIGNTGKPMFVIKMVGLTFGKGLELRCLHTSVLVFTG